MNKPIRAASLLAGAAACAVLTLTSPSASAQDIKIGSVVSATGPASFLGAPEDKTLRMYVDKINAEGGLIGKKLQLVVYDDGGDPNKARTFATRLVEEDKIVAMVGGSTTGSTLAMIPVFEDANIPFISLAGHLLGLSNPCASGFLRRRTPTRWRARKSLPISSTAI